MRRTTRVAAGLSMLLACPLLLAGCADYGTRQFGMRRDAQGQTHVMTPPPLSQPPILTNRSMARGETGPAPGTQAAQEARAASAAQGGTAAAPPSAGEEALLDASGPSAPGDIRARVDQDAQIGRADPGLSDQLLFGQAGQRGQAGGQPMIQREDRSWFDRIF
ncbi:MAG: DUF3035 domain-containing protein [Alphaproteobacteria bacterium]|nr:DUF3035 domain-containing protein [Alphaproteobacteria bacterium]